MGKGSRNRQVRVDDKAVNPQKYVQKKKTASKNYTSIITLIVTIFVAAALIFGAVSASGITLRTRTAMHSDNFKVTGTMMSYFFYTTYNEFYSQYSSYIGDMLDTSVSLKEQYYSTATETTEAVTWYDYFMEQTVANPPK